MAIALRDMRVGDTFEAPEFKRVQDSNGYYANTVTAGEIFTIRKHFTHRVQVQGNGYAFSIPYDLFGEVEQPQPFLDKFKPTDGSEIILPDDPRIDYIWRAAAQAADDAGYCPVYDQITAKVGLPGRPKNFTVNIQVGSLTTRVTIKARSKEEAKVIAAEQINGTNTVGIVED